MHASGYPACAVSAARHIVDYESVESTIQRLKEHPPSVWAYGRLEAGCPQADFDAAFHGTDSEEQAVLRLLDSEVRITMYSRVFFFCG